MAAPRRWVAGVAVVVLAAAVTGLVLTRGDETGPRCTDKVLASRTPLLDPAGMKAQPDERLDTLVAAVSTFGRPFGEVLAGVGFDYGQWLHLYGVNGGVLAWTKNNAPVALLDAATLKPRWSLRPASSRTAWDVSADRFLLLDLDASAPTAVSSYDLGTGHRRWCAELGTAHADGDPVATAFLDSGDVLTALAAGDRIRVTRLAGTDGRERWHRELSGTGRADFLTPLTGDLALAGGVEEYRLAEPAPRSSAAPVITAFSTVDGRAAWTWASGADTAAHVVGVGGGRVLVTVRSRNGSRLLALDAKDGSVLWQRTPRNGAFEATLRGGVVLMRSPAGLDAYSVSEGRPLWALPVPKDRTYFPYGFVLDQMPSLDADRVLVPTTTALLALDVRTGTTTTYPLPTDGLSTTYWPYQLLVTDDLLGVVTNTGGVLARRAPE